VLATDDVLTVARHSQVMSAERKFHFGNVVDWNTAVDLVFRCSVLQTLEHCDCERVLHSLWNVEPLQLVMQQL